MEQGISKCVSGNFFQGTGNFDPTPLIAQAHRRSDVRFAPKLLPYLMACYPFVGLGQRPASIQNVAGPRESKRRLSIFVRQAIRYIQQNECTKQGKSP
jgi:hypothetical protein